MHGLEVQILRPSLFMAAFAQEAEVVAYHPFHGSHEELVTHPLRIWACWRFGRTHRSWRRRLGTADSGGDVQLRPLGGRMRLADGGRWNHIALIWDG
jgi:hypothetical protein